MHEFLCFIFAKKNIDICINIFIRLELMSIDKKHMYQFHNWKGILLFYLLVWQFGKMKWFWICLFWELDFVCCHSIIFYSFFWIYKAAIIKLILIERFNCKNAVKFCTMIRKQERRRILILFMKEFCHPSCLVILQKLAVFSYLDCSAEYAEYCQFNFGHIV